MHFHNGKAIRQLEISDFGKVYLTNDNPQHGESFLYDQSLDELALEESDYISDEMFNEVWNDR
ncbi:hypothetical protein [Flavobacterium sp. N1736]|uniref:hypothetical protein n=1 Tax=Flavobacterium sp. N1736 TaxID=2986823 RepID=UPI00222417E5|nr:hypothetical protein [Flavobacterium sp. N1736]